MTLLVTYATRFSPFLSHVSVKEFTEVLKQDLYTMENTLLLTGFMTLNIG
jgi:hypothetical protein